MLEAQCSELSIALDQTFDINEVNTKHGTPLHAACLGRKQKVIRLLVDLGANINANVPGLGSPLHIACNRQNTKIAKLLLANGADVNIRKDRQPYTSLGILLQNEHRSESRKILCMLYEQNVVETGLSQLDAIRLEKMKKRAKLFTGGGMIGQERITAADTDPSGKSEP